MAYDPSEKFTGWEYYTEFFMQAEEAMDVEIQIDHEIFGKFRVAVPERRCSNKLKKNGNILWFYITTDELMINPQSKKAVRRLPSCVEIQPQMSGERAVQSVLRRRNWWCMLC